MNASHWYQQSIALLNRAVQSSGTSDSEMPITIRQVPYLQMLFDEADESSSLWSQCNSLFPCPTVRITHRFLSHLLEQYQAQKQQLQCPHSPARLVLNSYVFSVHGDMPLTSDAGSRNMDWTLILSYFPHTLRIIIELAVQQCRVDPNPNWPAYLLTLIERSDLCGK